MKSSQSKFHREKMVGEKSIEIPPKFHFENPNSKNELNHEKSFWNFLPRCSRVSNQVQRRSLCLREVESWMSEEGQNCHHDLYNINK